jgi:hypothetical protein
MIKAPKTTFVLDDTCHSIPWILFSKGSQIAGYGIDFFKGVPGQKSVLIAKIYTDKTM